MSWWPTRKLPFWFDHSLTDNLSTHCVLLSLLCQSLFQRSSLQNEASFITCWQPVWVQFYFSHFPPGLKAGDEILLLNGKPASALQMDDMRAVFAKQALTLSISTLPDLDPRVLCSIPPRRSDWEQDPATDIFSQSQGEASCSTWTNMWIYGVDV